MKGHWTVPVLASILILGSIGFATMNAVYAQVPPPSPPIQGDFKCFPIFNLGSTASFPIEVDVVDQFGIVHHDNVSPIKLCNPVVKAENLPDFPGSDTSVEPQHYLVYQIDGVDIDRQMIMADQFGPQFQDLGFPAELWIPGTKDIGGGPTPKTSDQHWKCYNLIDGEFPVPIPHVLDLTDQFNATQNQLINFKSVCAPAAKSYLGSPFLGDAGIPDHMQGYTITADPVKDVGFLTPVQFIDQIGTHTFAVNLFSPEFYAVAGKELVEGAVGGTSIPVDTTALLVAGAYTMTPWLILGVLSAVGIGLAVFTLKRSR